MLEFVAMSDPFKIAVLAERCALGTMRRIGYEKVKFDNRVATEGGKNLYFVLAWCFEVFAKEIK